jgi:hypothetical protein
MRALGKNNTLIPQLRDKKPWELELDNTVTHSRSKHNGSSLHPLGLRPDDCALVCVPGGDWRDVLARVGRGGLEGANIWFLPQQLDLWKREDTAVTTYSLLPWSFHFPRGGAGQGRGWARGGGGAGRSHLTLKRTILITFFVIPSQSQV